MGHPLPFRIAGRGCEPLSNRPMQWGPGGYVGYSGVETVVVVPLMYSTVT